MSSQPIVPDASTMENPSYGVGAPSSSTNVSQTPPASNLGNVVSAQPEPLPPVNGPSRLNNVLARIAGTPPPATPSASSGGVASGPNDGASDNTSSGGGWRSALGKAVSAVSTGLAGVPAGGRPSFLGGLGQGARADQAAQATAQDIKFKDFDSQVRLANLHNQDLELQLRTQEQQDAHQKAQDAQADYDEDHGISYDPHPNNGQAVLDTLQGQTQANGAAAVPSGTHLSADGNTVNVPDNSQETQAGLLQKYKDLQGPLSLPPLPQNAQFVPGRNLDVMTHKLGGYKADGSPWNHDDLPQQIAAMRAQSDALVKSGASPFQIATVNNTIGIMQAQSDALDKHAATVEQQKAQSKKSGEIAADMSPQGRALASSNEKLKEQAQDNQAANRQKINNSMVVAFDPDAPGLNGTKGANVVMQKQQADGKGLPSYKANPEKINGLVAGVNDVQTKINALADASADMSQVDPSVSATMSGNGVGLEWHGVGLGSLADIANSQGRVLANKGMNDATRNYIVALAGAHEAITQLPRLQTMGASSRVTEAQMQQAAKMLPTPGDDSDMANAKLHGLQNTIDPIRKQIPSMPGASLVPSFRENAGSNWSRSQRLPQTPAVKTPAKAAAFNYEDTM
jgi:hypothetical protein